MVCNQTFNEGILLLIPSINLSKLYNILWKKYQNELGKDIKIVKSQIFYLFNENILNISSEKKNINQKIIMIE